MRPLLDDLRQTRMQRKPSHLILLVALLSLHYHCDGEAQSKNPNLDTLVSILRERANLILTTLDQQIQDFGDGSPEAQSTIKKLRTLREQFFSLFEQHIAAVKGDNMLLEHECASKIYDVLSEIKTVIRERYAAIGKKIFDNLLFQYWVAPELGEDKAYDEATIEQGKMAEKADKISKSLVYPGPPDARVPAELFEHFFVTPTSSVPKE